MLPPTIPKPVAFTPRGYPLPSKTISYHPGTVALSSVAGITYVAAAFGAIYLVLTPLG